ncbi:MAG TPA: aldo/keto reductase [Aggregatilinea sp.]|uniref:aldo/keto reductase n=1 Tax=Aggregatilinea sp. TaxID=2806333 RepID=UPI002C019539|nr:aldo/keto reductase [Aggregatilinea sp.]HML23966.1 aldo/keto reductase [Aggregatilinea sp.]
MKFRQLGKSGLRVSVIGIGTWQFGGEWGKDFTQPEADAILGRAHDLDINLIDTAECYGDHLSEQMVGKAVRHNRQDWIIATKFGHHFNARFDRDTAYAPGEVRQQLEDSLRALQTDYIDLYQFHSGSNDAFDQPELWDMLAEQVQAGKIRAVGLSISPNTNIYQTARAASVGASAIQVVYNRLDRIPEEEVLPACLEDYLGVLARVPLASGLLSGKYKPGTRFTDDTDVRSTRSEDQIQAQLAEVENIQAQEVPEGVNMATWALAWCLQHPAVTCVIPGCKSPEQVEANARAADLDMVRADHPQALA